MRLYNFLEGNLIDVEMAVGGLHIGSPTTHRRIAQDWSVAKLGQQVCRPIVQPLISEMTRADSSLAQGAIIEPLH
jgi:hypothetical protein